MVNSEVAGRQNESYLSGFKELFNSPCVPGIISIHGMIVVGGADWRSAFGASAVVSEDPYLTENEKGKVSDYFLEKGRALGNRVATLTLKLNRTQKVATPEPGQ